MQPYGPILGLRFHSGGSGCALEQPECAYGRDLMACAGSAPASAGDDVCFGLAAHDGIR